MKKDLIDKRFGRLVVIAEEGKNKYGNYLWKCRCDCGKETIVASGSLLRGATKSCGCFGRENLKNINDKKRKKNDFYMKDGCVHIILSNTGKEMLCDALDWYELSKYCWYENQNGYARSSVGYFHKRVCETVDGLVVDHINRDKLDNRRKNLRSVTKQQNALNNNALGVTWLKAAKKWAAGITIDGKHIHIGVFETRDEAEKARAKYKENLEI